MVAIFVPPKRCDVLLREIVAEIIIIKKKRRVFESTFFFKDYQQLCLKKKTNLIVN